MIQHYFYPGKRNFSNRFHVLVTVALTAVSLAIALTTCNLGVVLELTGCFSATALAFILPPLCYLKLAGGNGGGHGHGEPWWRGHKLAPTLCLVFGVVVMLTSTFTILGETFWPDEQHLVGKVKDCGW